SSEGASALVVPRDCDWLLVSSHQIGVCLTGAAEQFRASPAEERLERPGPGAVRLKFAVERVTVVHVSEWSCEDTADLYAEMMTPVRALAGSPTGVTVSVESEVEGVNTKLVTVNWARPNTHSKWMTGLTSYVPEMPAAGGDGGCDCATTHRNVASPFVA